jgi:hypothetical protein
MEEVMDIEAKINKNSGFYREKVLSRVILSGESIARIPELLKFMSDPDSKKGKDIEAKIKEILILFGEQSFLV